MFNAISISQIITEMNQRLAMDFSNTGRFMTLFYLSIDTANQSFSWVRAGHDAAVVYDPQQGEFEELMGAGLADDITLVVLKISDFPGAVDDWRI